jgi:nucleotide-binding universal stress UspA family protein
MAEQITHILVPVDFSVHAEKAVNYAITLVQRFGGTAELLHVVEDPFVSGAWSADAFTPDIPELMNDLIADARVRLDTLKTAAAKVGVTCTTRVVTGKPSRVITDHAKTGAFDLIVMGTHGHSGLSHLFLGSVAERVVRTAPCPVLTMRDNAPHTDESRVEAAATAS